MQKYRTGEDLALIAMQKELKRLQAKADKARAEADECANIGSELSAVHQAFAKIVDSKATGEAVLKELEALQKRRDKALQILGKNIDTLFEKQFVAEQDVQSLASYVSQIEFRMALRQSAHD